MERLKTELTEEIDKATMDDIERQLLLMGINPEENTFLLHGVSLRNDIGEYRTRVLSTKIVNVTGYPGNQPSGGIKFSSPQGGSFNYTPDGGPSKSVSVNFGSPYGTTSVSFTLGKRTDEVTSYSLSVPGYIYIANCGWKKSIPLWSVSAMISMIIIIVILISYIYQVKQWMPETKNIIGTFSYQDVDGTKEYIVFDREERCYFYKSGEYIDKGEYVWERTDKNSADIVVITDIGEKAGTKEVLFFDNKLYFFSQEESKFVIFEKENDVPTFYNIESPK